MFEKDTANGVIALDLAHHERSSLLEKTLNIQEQSKTKNQNKKAKKKDTYENGEKLYEVREMALNVFKSGIFPVKNPIQVITTH